LYCEKQGRYIFIPKDAEIETSYDPARDYYTTKEFGDMISMKPREVRRAIRQGAIPATKENRQYRIPKSLLDQWEKQVADWEKNQNKA
jgi:excisionase family DNA binding protein